MESVIRYECDGKCDFWNVLHGNPDNIKYEEKLKKCQGCTRPERIRNYKDFWDVNRPSRTKEK